MDFDNVRYLDIREKNQFYFEMIKDYPKKEFELPSDATKRIDACTLLTGDVKLA